MDNKWREYERRKALILFSAKDSKEYEEMIKKLAEELDV